MGFTFKENCPDIRNTKIARLVEELATFSLSVQIYDPLADPAHVMNEYGMELTQNMPQGPFDAIVLAVRHDEIVNLDPRRHRALLAPGGIIYDIKGILAVGASDGRL
jgi:UDP-N-acetyl-D-galactosamine dehydrogenase